MKLVEHDGKRLLKAHGLRIPAGVFLPTDATAWPTDQPWTGPRFIKAQTLSGRRGVSGLVQRCERQEDVAQTVSEILSKLGDVPCAGFLCEEEVTHTEEWLLAVDVDRERQEVSVVVSPQGGSNVASATRIPFADVIAQPDGNLPEGIRAWVLALGELMREEDALSVEINPLAKTAGGWVALDAKIELDDLALERHPDAASFIRLSPYGRVQSEREMTYAAFLKEMGHRGTLGRYVELDGDIALILSGGGASLVALDALRTAGKKAANYVEVSGNPEPAAVERAARIVLSKPDLKALWIAGSSANFTDIFETVRAVLDAVTGLGLRIPIVIRREGPRADEAETFVKTWSETYDAPVLFHRGDISLDASAKALAAL